MSASPIRSLAIKMVRRSAVWKRSTFVPAVIFTGPHREAQASIFAGAVAGEVPNADVSHDHGRQTTFRTLIDRAAGGTGDLGARVPGSWLPAPRFPLTQIILFALRIHEEREQPPEENRGDQAGSGSQRSRDAVYEERLREWRRRRAPLRSFGGRFEYFVRFLGGPSIVAAIVTVLLTKWLETAGAANVFILASSFVGAVLAALAMARFWSSGTYRHRWFCTEPYVRRGEREALPAYLRRVAEQEDDAVIERLLMFAFLEDLRLAYRRKAPWPGWGRGGYAVLRLGDIGRDAERTNFLKVMHRVLTDTGRKVPLLVVAEADVWPAGLCGDDHPSAARVNPAGPDLLRAHADWQDSAQRVSPCPYLVMDRSAAYEKFTDVPQVKRRALRRFRPVGYWLLVATTILLPLGGGGWWVLRPCGSGLSSMNGECIGLSSATVNYDSTLAPILRLITDQNDFIPADAKIYRIIYFGQLTRSGEQDPGHSLVGTAAELTGLYARQLETNKQQSDWKVQVEFANPGQDFTNARMAADAIVKRAAWDRSIAAVVGLGWSRTEVRTALEILCGAQLPAVTTSAGADRLRPLGGKMCPYFYRMAALNSHQARVAVHWLKTGLPLQEGKLPENPKVAILQQRDELEIYSEDMADEFAKIYPANLYRRYVYTDDKDLRYMVEQACREYGALFYTGRAALFPVLDDAWRTHCAKRNVPVLSSDDVTSMVATETKRNPQGHNMDVRFISLSDPRTDESAPVANNHESVVREIMKQVETERKKSTHEGHPPPVPLPADHVMLTHDAALAVTTAFDWIRGYTDGMDVSAGVQDNLRGLEVAGATGAITFPMGKEPHDAQNRRLWLMRAVPRERLERVDVCHVENTMVVCEGAQEAKAPS
ncbi:hypothetical protein [Nonomuraea monospora]